MTVSFIFIFFGYFILVLLGLTVFSYFFLALAVTSFLLYTTLEGGPIFLPSPMEKVKKMLKLAKVGKGSVVVDLGSGDGRILIEAAKLGAKAIGYELDPLLVFQSRKKIKKAGLSHLAKVNFKSFWRADLDKATAITLYLLPQNMAKMKKMLTRELKKPIPVVSLDYPISDKKHLKKIKNIYLYRFP